VASVSVLLGRRGADIAIADAALRDDAMSGASFGTVIDTLLTHDNVRRPMAFDPIDIVAELCRRGSDLSRDEVDIFLCGTDACVWLPKKRARRAAPQRRGSRIVGSKTERPCLLTLVYVQCGKRLSSILARAHMS
jgi:hypothetical protein